MSVRVTQLGFLTIGIICEACSGEPQLSLRVKTRDQFLVVTNQEQTSASECVVTINNKWSVKDVTFPPSDEVTIPLGEFTLADGTRFSVTTTRVDRILVHCFQPTSRVASFG